MAWNPPTRAEIAVGKAVTNPLMTKIRDSLMFLYGATTGALGWGNVVNGNFEIDSDSDGVPDGWSFTTNHATTYPGGTVALETTSPLEGAASLKMVHPGGASNGGGLAESDYIPCTDDAPFTVSFLHYASAAGMKNQVIVYWYDKDQVAMGTASTTIYESEVHPTAPTYFTCAAYPPADTKYCTIGLVGGLTDTDVAGTAYFDSVSISTPQRRVYTIPGSVASITFQNLTSKRVRISYYNPMVILVLPQCHCRLVPITELHLLPHRHIGGRRFTMQRQILH